MGEDKKVFSIKQFILGKQFWLTKEKDKDKKLTSYSVSLVSHGNHTMMGLLFFV